MRYRISEVAISAEEYGDVSRRMKFIERALCRKLKKLDRGSFQASHPRTGGDGKVSRVSNLEIIRESIDARRKPQVKAVYTLDFDCDGKLPLPEGGRREYVPPAVCPAEGTLSPVIAGFGPCGIFAALLLARAGLKPLVIERGKSISQRCRDVQRFWQEGILDPESNVQFGEGGAGTFSDGKLTTGIRDVRIQRVLQEFVNAGADPAILYQQRPHIGTDRLRFIIPRLRRSIEEAGGQVLFQTKLTGLITEGNQLTAVCVQQEGEARRIPARHLILAIGHSARDTFRMLREYPLPMEQKSFSIGVRIEHPQQIINQAQYGDGKLADIFGPASYKLHHRCDNGRGVYTFCMCPGGQVINAASQQEGAVTNGMSDSLRDGARANSGLLVDVRPSDFGSPDPLAGVAFQERYEHLAWQAGRAFAGGLPRTTYGAFQQEEDPVRGCLPAFASEAILEAMPHLGKKLHGFDAEDAVMTAVETRSSSPVRIVRDASMRTSLQGVIPAGEGPGYAGGIMSAAVDGMKAAEQVMADCHAQ